jgi:hypothetical protein
MEDFDFPTILSVGQCKNGMENKVKHLILFHNLSEWKIVISLPFYPLDNARMEWNGKQSKTFDTFSQSIRIEDCDFPTILSIGQCKNGMENKVKHLILFSQSI